MRGKAQQTMVYLDEKYNHVSGWLTGTIFSYTIQYHAYALR